MVSLISQVSWLTTPSLLHYSFAPREREKRERQEKKVHACNLALGPEYCDKTAPIPESEAPTSMMKGIVEFG